MNKSAFIIALFFFYNLLPTVIWAQEINAGRWHTLLICTDSNPYAWGGNQQGQLGINSFSNQNSPVQVDSLNSLLAVNAGFSHSLMLNHDSTVWACGFNSAGQLGDGTTSSRSGPFKVPLLNSISEIAAGAGHSIYVKADSTAWICGLNNWGQLGDSTTINKSSPFQLSTISGVKGAAAGYAHSVFLKYDGTVWSCGYNTDGQLGDGTTSVNRLEPVQAVGLSNIIDVDAGYSHSLFLKSDSTVWATGHNYYGQLGIGNMSDQSTPVQIPGLSGIVAIAAGNHHSLFLKHDGTVWACGRNNKGQLGDGTSNSRSTPTQVSSLSNIRAIDGGILHSVFLKDDGTVWTCGDNANGQLGDGSTIIRTTPVQSGVTCCFSSFYSQNQTICEGDSFRIGTQSYTVAGTYIDTLLSAGNCDSVVTTNLTVNPRYLDTISISIPQGDSIAVDSNVYTTTGTYYDTLTTTMGCDSVIITFLTVTPVSGLLETDLYTIQLFPNPFSEELLLDCDQPMHEVEIKLFNAQGQVVMQQAYSSGKRFIIHRRQSWQSGLYFLQITSRNIVVLNTPVQIVN